MIGRFLAQHDERIAVLTGFAGTGKTSLLRVIADQYGTPLVLTPTGKAALRVSEASGLDASTIHRFLYKADEDPKTGEPIFTPHDPWELREIVDGDLVLIDEASMVSQQIWGDLIDAARHADFKILLVGDRFQLPPVTKDKSGKFFSALDIPTPFTVNLTEVIRQALESPILRASVILRTTNNEADALSLLEPIGVSKLIPTLVELRQKKSITLVHRNATRHKLNREAREALGYEADTLNPGEPLLVLHNNYPLDRYNGEVVDFNMWTTPPTEETRMAVLDRYTNSSLEMGFGVAYVEQTPCMLSLDEVNGRTEQAKIGIKSIKKSARYMYEHMTGESDARPPSYLNTNYGYALTVHKSQGSEFDEALVVIEGSLHFMAPLERRRFLYTAITRAKQKLYYTYL